MFMVAYDSRLAKKNRITFSSRANRWATMNTPKERWEKRWIANNICILFLFLSLVIFFPITTFSEASNISLTWFLNNTWAWRLFLEKPSKGNVGSFETRGVFRVWFASQCATFQTLNSKPRVSSPFSLLSLISSVIKIYSLFSGIKAYFDNQFEKLNEERREKNIKTRRKRIRLSK